ncbi:MAG: hypothetical protein GEV07_05485 [Streptosporangiales bacterium]|nr:hypothetical protein [Streptosporangiales bacterium]
MLRIDTTGAKHPASVLLGGVNNNRWHDDSLGLWDPEAGHGVPDAVEKTARAGVSSIRYPGGTQANLFDWKRAVGPLDDRECQVDGGNGTPRDSRYGPDEHMTFTGETGARASIMVPFANETPADAADWVEYMNAPAGTNPRGGVAWADLRAANGHRKPYGVEHWEVGNEHDRPEQRYWMSSSPSEAMQQYAFGGTQRQLDQPVGTACDHRDSASYSNGSADSSFQVHYPPVVEDSQAVYVDGEKWRAVDDLEGAGPDDEVYTFDPRTGRVAFGDGTHGRIPPEGAQVTADYDSGPHAGFVDFAAAMKKVDPDIDVLATWAPITSQSGLGDRSFPELMADRGERNAYDGLVIHPYTNFRRDFGDALESAQQGHDWHMLGEANATELVRQARKDVRRYGGKGSYITTTEFGALFFGPHDASAYPSWNTAMSHALYMASQWARWSELGLPWAEGNTLVAEEPQGLRAVLGGAPGFAYTSEAVVRQQLQPFLTGGGKVVPHQLVGNPQVSTDPTDLGSSYDGLVGTTTVDRDGQLNVLVVNRMSTRAADVTVVPGGFTHTGTVTASTVAGEDFTSFNNLDHPDDVRIERSERQVGSTAFDHTFPAHSVTLLRLDPAR